MAIIKCSLCNQYYDNTVRDNCPYCSNSFPFSHTERNEKTIGYYEETDEHDKTIGLFFQENEYNPVTAWIVCIFGTVLGKSYEIHMNRNYIGRDKLMDVSIPDDLQVCRENHLSITYDDKSKRFFAKNENGALLINGNLIQSAVEIFADDVLEFGESRYVFIPYCTKERNWDDK